MMNYDDIKKVEKYNKIKGEFKLDENIPQIELKQEDESQSDATRKKEY